jgi:hypothetical protein
VAQIDLHAGDGAANLLGLADQIVALIGEDLQHCADAHLGVAVGALERRHLIGNQGLEFPGTRDRALDAVAHGGDLAANGLTDGHHRVAGRALGLRETDRDLRHRLRDHAQFLTAPGKTGEEIDQHHRRDEQCREAGQRQYAATALTDRGPQRWQEAEHQDCRADDPDRGKERGESVDAARGPALLNGLQNLPDGFAIVIGGAARRARLLDRIEYLPILARPGVERAVVVRGRRCAGRRRIVAWRTATVVEAGRLADVEGFLDGRKRDLGRVFDLLWIVRHVQSEPSCYFVRVQQGLARLSQAKPVLSP